MPTLDFHEFVFTQLPLAVQMKLTILLPFSSLPYQPYFLQFFVRVCTRCYTFLGCLSILNCNDACHCISSAQRVSHSVVLSLLLGKTDLYYVKFGKCIHGLSLKDGLEFDIYVRTSLIDMYVKCGELGKAHKLFDVIPLRDVSSWNTLISGYMRDGVIDLAKDVFENMPKKNIVSWTSMISGYIQNGLVGDALRLFDEMLSDDSEVKPNWVTVMSVLPACAHLTALDWGRKIHTFAREKMYAEASIYEEVNHLRALLESHGIKKNPDCSWIEINGKAHLFLGGDTSHPQSMEIYRLLEGLPEKIKAAVY